MRNQLILIWRFKPRIHNFPLKTYRSTYILTWNRRKHTNPAIPLKNEDSTILHSVYPLNCH